MTRDCSLGGGTLKWSKSSLECRSELHWPQLSIQHQYLCIVMVHDMLHGHVALKFFSFTSTCTRTHSLTIYCKQSTINSYKYSFFVNSIFLWNKVPECILGLLKCNSLTHFLFNLLVYLCACCFCILVHASFCFVLSFFLFRLHSYRSILLYDLVF